MWCDHLFESSRRDDTTEWSHHKVLWWNNEFIVKIFGLSMLWLWSCCVDFAVEQRYMLLIFCICSLKGELLTVNFAKYNISEWKANRSFLGNDVKKKPVQHRQFEFSVYLKTIIHVFLYYASGVIADLTWVLSLALGFISHTWHNWMTLLHF